MYLSHSEHPIMTKCFMFGNITLAQIVRHHSNISWKTFLDIFMKFCFYFVIMCHCVDLKEKFTLNNCSISQQHNTIDISEGGRFLIYYRGLK